MNFPYPCFEIHFSTDTLCLNVCTFFQILMLSPMWSTQSSGLQCQTVSWLRTLRLRKETLATDCLTLRSPWSPSTVVTILVSSEKLTHRYIFPGWSLYETAMINMELCFTSSFTAKGAYFTKTLQQIAPSDKFNLTVHHTHVLLHNKNLVIIYRYRHRIES